MLKTRILCFLIALGCAFSVAQAVSAAETSCDSVYCFSSEDFSGQGLMGICLTELPEREVGQVLLGSRVLRPGDILTREQACQMTFHPVRSEHDAMACVSYLPIFQDHVAPETTLTLAIHGKEDKAPGAEDLALETYKNLPLEGKLKVTDPEGQAMTFTVTRQPRRGTVAIHADGSFTYTPKKNKVGVDSFTFTATDPAGKVSREATVTVTILKPTDSTFYTDTMGKSCRFAAEWMKNTGIFTGETLDRNACFSPEKAVTKGEFVTMLVRALEIPTDEALSYTGYGDQIPVWLRPYLAAAVRSGLMAGLPAQETFDHAAPITGAEAAVMIHNALDLAVVSPVETQIQPVWAADALTTLEGYGMSLPAGEILNRGQTAQLLYQTVSLADQAPGMRVIRMEQ